MTEAVHPNPAELTKLLRTADISLPTIEQINQMSPQQAALFYVTYCDLSILPITPGSKAPYYRNWPQYRATKKDITQKWPQKRPHATTKEQTEVYAIGCVLGKPSRELLCFDIETHSLWKDFSQKAQYILEFYDPPISSSGKGNHLFFRIEADSPHLKEKGQTKQHLAFMQINTNQKEFEVAIELLRGGEQVLLAPSLYPGKRKRNEKGQETNEYMIPEKSRQYQWINGHPIRIPVISSQHLEELIQIAKSLSEKRDTKPCGEGEREEHPKNNPIAEFNQRFDVCEILERNGYQQAQRDRYIRPGGKNPSVKIVSGRSIHYNSNDSLHTGTNQSRDAFDVFCQLEHGGDMKEAVKAAAHFFQPKQAHTNKRKKPQAQKSVKPQKQKKEKLSQNSIAKHFLAQHQNWKWDDTAGCWMHYQTGQWKESTPLEVGCQIQNFLQDLGQGFTDSFVKGVESILKRWSAHSKWNQSTHLVPFRDCVLDINTHQILPHSPEHHLTWQLPCTYDPEAKIRYTYAFLHNMFSGDMYRLQTVRAFLAMVLRGTIDHKFLELTGIAGTGKSTLLKLAMTLVGQDNVFVTNLSAIEAKGNAARFELYGIVGKRLVVISECDKWNGSLETLKNITGGDYVRVEQKYVRVSGKGYKPKSIVFVAGNKPIQGTDESGSVFRRRVTIPCNYQPPPHMRVSDSAMEALFQSELSGIVNWLLQLSEEDIKERISESYQSESVAAQRMNVLLEAEPLADWIHTNLIYSRKIGVETKIGSLEKETITQKADNQNTTYTSFPGADTQLYPNYVRFCSQTGKRPINKNNFSQRLCQFFSSTLKLPIQKIRREHGRIITNLRLRRTTESLQELPSPLEIAKTQWMHPPSKSLSPAAVFQKW